MIFKTNKYTTIYFQLMEKRRNTPLDKGLIYCESHHIYPKSLGGKNDPDNLVNLLPREHFIAHLLLTKMVEDEESFIKMSWALHKMCYSGIDYFNSKDYDWYRRRHVNFLKDHHHSKRLPNWNQKMRELVTSQWENAENRRLETSKTFSDSHAFRKQNDPLYFDDQKSRSRIGAQKSKEVVAARLEYKGRVYMGFKELLESTGISKHLYKKYYLNNIDPTDRIGKNGPIPKMTISQ